MGWLVVDPQIQLEPQPGCWIAENSNLNSLKSIFESSNLKSFLTVRV